MTVTKVVLMLTIMSTEYGDFIFIYIYIKNNNLPSEK